MRKWKRAGGCRSERPIRRRSAQSTIFSVSRSRNIAPVIQWRRCKVEIRKQEAGRRKEEVENGDGRRRSEVGSRTKRSFGDKCVSVPKYNLGTRSERGGGNLFLSGKRR